MWSGIFLTVVVYSFNMFGDAVRDLLDPRLRGGVGRMGAHLSWSHAESARRCRKRYECARRSATCTGEDAATGSTECPRARSTYH